MNVQGKKETIIKAIQQNTKLNEKESAKLYNNFIKNFSNANVRGGDIFYNAGESFRNSKLSNQDIKIVENAILKIYEKDLKQLNGNAGNLLKKLDNINTKLPKHELVVQSVAAQCLHNPMNISSVLANFDKLKNFNSNSVQNLQLTKLSNKFIENVTVSTHPPNETRGNGLNFLKNICDIIKSSWNEIVNNPTIFFTLLILLIVAISMICGSLWKPVLHAMGLDALANMMNFIIFSLDCVNVINTLFKDIVNKAISGIFRVNESSIKKWLSWATTISLFLTSLSTIFTYGVYANSYKNMWNYALDDHIIKQVVKDTAKGRSYMSFEQYKLSQLAIKPASNALMTTKVLNSRFFSAFGILFGTGIMAGGATVAGVAGAVGGGGLVALMFSMLQAFKTLSNAKEIEMKVQATGGVIDLFRRIINNMFENDKTLIKKWVSSLEVTEGGTSFFDFKKVEVTNISLEIESLLREKMNIKKYANLKMFVGIFIITVAVLFLKHPMFQNFLDRNYDPYFHKTDKLFKRYLVANNSNVNKYHTTEGASGFDGLFHINLNHEYLPTQRKSAMRINTNSFIYPKKNVMEKILKRIQTNRHIIREYSDMNNKDTKERKYHTALMNITHKFKHYVDAIKESDNLKNIAKNHLKSNPSKIKRIKLSKEKQLKIKELLINLNRNISEIINTSELPKNFWNNSKLSSGNSRNQGNLRNLRNSRNQGNSTSDSTMNNANSLTSTKSKPASTTGKPNNKRTLKRPFSTRLSNNVSGKGGIQQRTLPTSR